MDVYLSMSPETNEIALCDVTSVRRRRKKHRLVVEVESLASSSKKI